MKRANEVPPYNVAVMQQKKVNKKSQNLKIFSIYNIIKYRVVIV